MTKPQNILIVEDEPIVQLHLQRIISDAGHRVSGTASTAQQALEAAEREVPELVLMDIRLPGSVDGVDLARTLCDRHDCGVVFATAYADPGTVERTEDIGAAGYIVKPFTDTDVRAAIRTAIAGRERLRRNRRRERSLSSMLGRRGEGVLITNEAGEITLADATAQRITGWESADARGRDVVEVLGLQAAPDAEDLRLAMASCLADGRPDSLSRFRIVRRDGRERVVDVEIDPIGEEGREASGLVVALRDRTLRSVGSRPARVEGVGRFGAGTRMLVYSHDTFGLGHLQRCRNLIRRLLERNPDLSVLLVTGSPAVHRYELPRGADYVKLPTVRKVGPECYEARSLSISGQKVLTLRSNLILRTVRDYQPNVLLVDHAPLGMSGEILPALEWLGRVGGCTTILGLRDIVDRPSSVVSLWKKQGIYDVLRDLYDHVLVYGSKKIHDPVSLYEFPAEVAAKTRFTHYVCETGPPTAPELRAAVGGEPLVAVSIGGGDGGVETVIDPFLEMLRRHGSEIGFRSEIITGPLLPPEAQARVRQQARGLPVVVRDFVPSTTALFESADLVVSTGGYNTMTQLLGHARRAIVIPRALHRQEQLIRARRMMELGLVTCIHPEEVEPGRLGEEILRSLGDCNEPLTRGRAAGVVPLDGVERVADFCEGLTIGASAGGRYVR